MKSNLDTVPDDDLGHGNILLLLLQQTSSVRQQGDCQPHEMQLPLAQLGEQCWMDVRVQGTGQDRGEDLATKEGFAGRVRRREELLWVVGGFSSRGHKDVRVEVEFGDELDGEERVGSCIARGVSNWRDCAVYAPNGSDSPLIIFSTSIPTRSREILVLRDSCQTHRFDETTDTYGQPVPNAHHQGLVSQTLSKLLVQRISEPTGESQAPQDSERIVVKRLQWWKRGSDAVIRQVLQALLQS
jgi:hypothetical protein